METFECSEIINKMANVYYDQGKLNEALEYYKRSLSIK